MGPRLLRRSQSRLFNPRNIERAQAYFDRYGAKTLVLARFVPVVRTFAPPVAGVPAIACFLGQLIPDLNRYLLLIIGVVITLSLIPVGLELLRGRNHAS